MPPRERLSAPAGKAADLYRDLPSGRVQCTACARGCQMAEGQIGFCGVRGVVGGRLYLLVYGRVVAGHIDPIEKKPVVHYRPGSKVFSIATSGCSWACAYCQNSDISQLRRIEGVDAPPADVVRMAADNGCEGLAYTYNQPTIFLEYARDIGKLARAKGLFNVFVTNGYDTPEAVSTMGEFLDCATVDFKGSGERGFLRRHVGVPDAAPIFQSLKEMKDRTRIHVEVTDLIVPGVGDSLEAAEHLCRWLYDNLGPDVPIHFLRFHPDYKMMDVPPTPVRSLEKHVAVGRAAGLRYVYIGNVPGHPDESTYCPGCGAVAVKRYGYDILGYNIDGRGRCASCGYALPVVGPFNRSSASDRFASVIG